MLYHVATIQASGNVDNEGGERGRIIALAIGVHPFFVASKLISASFSQLSVRSSGMLQPSWLLLSSSKAASLVRGEWYP